MKGRWFKSFGQISTLDSCKVCDFCAGEFYFFVLNSSWIIYCCLVIPVFVLLRFLQITTITQLPNHLLKLYSHDVGFFPFCLTCYSPCKSLPVTWFLIFYRFSSCFLFCFVFFCLCPALVVLLLIKCWFQFYSFFFFAVIKGVPHCFLCGIGFSSATEWFEYFFGI